MPTLLDAHHRYYALQKERARKEKLALLLRPLPKKPKSDWRLYKIRVWQLTRKQNLSALPNIELRAFRKYDLDHIISVWDGFNYDVPAELIAAIENLRIITHRENTVKGRKSE